MILILINYIGFAVAVDERGRTVAEVARIVVLTPVAETLLVATVAAPVWQGKVASHALRTVIVVFITENTILVRALFTNSSS